MKYVKSTKVYSPQNFVEILTGICYGFDCDDTAREIRDLLKLNKIKNDFNKNLRDYAIDEIDKIVLNNISVVLVDTTYIDENCKMVQEYRWFEVPNSFNDTES